MNMILVHPYFEKLNLIAICNFQTHFLQNLVNLFVYHSFSVFGWTYKMIEQDRHIMTFLIRRLMQ